MKNFKFLFIFPNMYGNIYFSPAIGTLAACLKKNDFQVDLIHIHPDLGLSFDAEKIAGLCKKKRPDAIGITSTTFEYASANQLAKKIKEVLPGTPLILGGVHSTLVPEDIERSHFDIFARGECDFGLVELCERMFKGGNYYDVESFWFKKEGGIVKNRMRPQIENLDLLPYWERDIFNMEKIMEAKQGWIDVMTMRDCPYDCSYCSNHILRKIYKEETGKVFATRQRSVANVISEIKGLVKKYGRLIKVVNLAYDDLLILNKGWTLDFCRRYQKEVGLPFSCASRPELVDDERMTALKKAGCFEVGIGVETGNEELRRNVLNRKIDNATIERAFGICHSHGLNIYAFQMTGVPHETPKTIMDSVDLYARLRPRLIRNGIYQPLPKTRLGDYCAQKGMVDTSKGFPINYLEESILRQDGITQEEVLFFHRLMPWYINTRISRAAAPLYESMIKMVKEFGKDELKDKDTFCFIRELDSEVSKLLQIRGIEHYHYLPTNAFYLKLFKGATSGKTGSK
jgi:anaerobic magnesium-protoporphyrin IX monomethyl ester cyclase